MRLDEIFARQPVQAVGNLVDSGDLVAARDAGRQIAARPEIAMALVEGIEQGVAEGAVDELAAEGIAINPAGHAP